MSWHASIHKGNIFFGLLINFNNLHDTINITQSNECITIINTALGVGFFVGIRVTGYDMRATGDRYMKESEVMDLEYRHSLGI
ncbi:hypothetical protein PT043_08940, partial [Erysipelothrix rhusiopathiae]|nr:hypothetical protein [Erysipelothrix rhusiopathiae]